ncbi:MAG: nucleotidyltransferase domain-containing protein [Nanoarchaeota archaeon]|nr:nucleotidyltransferase domain-containing protein [Nanoarchaeota archaeon]
MNNYQDTENKILGNLLKTPLESKSMHQIAKETKLSYVTVHKIIPFLIKRKLIKLEKKGKASLISIDFEEASIDRLSSAAIYGREKYLRKYPQIILLTRDIEEKLTGMFYSLILFGSYAKGYPRPDSDLDLLFIVPERKDVEKYKEKINKASQMTTGKKHIVTVSIEDFMDMLNQQYTVGREAFQYGLVLFGTEQYYAMVKQYVREHGY